MKPGDHPEFFRFPPPPGASRDSTIVLDRQGRFFHDGAPVEKKSLADAMHQWVSTHPDDGRYILTNGYDWCYFAVEDTPAFVVSVVGEPPNAPRLVLADGTEEELDPATLVQDEDGACFARVKGGKFEARFLRLAQIALAPWLVEVDGGVRLRIGADMLPIGQRTTS
ncbi:MAG: hypothetical protein HOW73_07285 [Polyangiaceae bacterium]|nr:hypothetical protein [Polyangiaceae bacterium]